MGKWVKYNKNYFYLFIYLYLFFFDQPTGQTRGWIFMHDSPKDVKLRKGVPFSGLNDVPLNFGDKTPKTEILGA